jgi:hypothetical protein
MLDLAFGLSRTIGAGVILWVEVVTLLDDDTSPSSSLSNPVRVSTVMLEGLLSYKSLWKSAIEKMWKGRIVEKDGNQQSRGSWKNVVINKAATKQQQWAAC